MEAGFVRAVTLMRDRVPAFDAFPFTIPAINSLETLELDPGVTFFIGENGAGKSTLIEALAIAAGFNAEGGSKNFTFSTRRSESPLAQYLRLTRGARRPRDGFFLRAESFFNAATYIDETAGADAYGGKSLHEQSHGESFLALVTNRFFGDGLYILDEPEAALSPARQLSLLQVMNQLVTRRRSQFIVATHSPLLMAYPDALIYQLDTTGFRRVAYQETEHFQLTKAFLDSPERYFRHLFAEERGGEDGP
jgi:predicted ATPase